MLKWSYRKYLPKGGRMLCAFGGRFERYTHLTDRIKPYGVFALKEEDVLDYTKISMLMSLLV